jgi:receptor protein-tyrosine kinase
VTRLNDALERARAEEGATAASPEPAAGEPQLSWRFDVDETPKAAPTVAGHQVPEAPQTVGSLPSAAKLVVRTDADASLVEQFRRLAAALHHAQTAVDARTVMIASAVEAEGKTLTATNLALTLSESYQRRVLLVDADLRRPSVHAMFQLDNSAGLGDVLKGGIADAKLPVHRVSQNLWVLTAGKPTSDPMSLLISETMREFLEDAAAQFDWVVIDTPPVALLPDANLLAAMIDTALLVVRANSTPYPLSMRAVESIGVSRILGVVLNRAERSEVASGYKYYSYSYSHPKPAKPRRRFRLAFRKT